MTGWCPQLTSRRLFCVFTNIAIYKLQFIAKSKYTNYDTKATAKPCIRKNYLHPPYPPTVKNIVIVQIRLYTIYVFRKKHKQIQKEYKFM